jgi:hypothetical protein
LITVAWHNRKMQPVAFDDLPASDLVVDARYEAGSSPNVSSDPLAKLLPVGNQGGFRYNGSVPSPRLVVLFANGTMPEWPDEVDQATGTVTYYGDNRHAGRQLHDTPRKGNVILFESFGRMRESAEARAQLPVFLLFESEGRSRDINFRGLVVPGSPLLHADEEINAVWRSEKGQRFQNYRAKFTVLDVEMISRAWINDIVAGNPLSPNAPKPWLAWVERFRYSPLAAPATAPGRTREEQLPAIDDPDGWKLLDSVYREFIPDPYRFERIAVAIAQLAVPLPMAMEVTRPVADGGRDAIGTMSIGPGMDPVQIHVALEAKCYAPGMTAAGVKDMSRLTSRLRYRDLGFFVTTSYVGKQAYDEIRSDLHPVVVLSGGDIIRELRRTGVYSPGDFVDWHGQFM